MDLKQLETFIVIANIRNFRAAANRLNLSQPAISMRLKTLEDELGVQLLDRSDNRVQLTGPGLQLIPIAEEILEGARKLKATAVGDVEIHQHIRLGATSTIANAWMCKLIDNILVEHHHLVIDVVVDTTPNLRLLLTTGKIDVAILMGAVHESGINNVHIKSYKNKWVAGKELTLPDEKLSLADLASYPIITYGKDSATYSNLEDALRQSGKWSTTVVSTCASVGTMLKLLSLNKHIGIINEACLPDDRLKVIDCEMKLPTYEYYIAYHLDSIGITGMAVADMAKNLC